MISIKRTPVGSREALRRFSPFGLKMQMRMLRPPPPPTPDFLTKDLYLDPGLERSFFLRRRWSDKKLLPRQLPANAFPCWGESGLLAKGFPSE